LIPLLGVPYDTFNLLHRWLGRIVVLEALAHVFAYCIPKASEGTSIYPIHIRYLLNDETVADARWFL
jgi:hypothetical protein